MSGRPAPLALRELLARPELLEPPPALIPGLAYTARTTLLSAREKAGKSTFVGQAISEYSRGAPHLGQQLAAGRALWYPLDESLGDAVRRFSFFGADPDMVTVQEQPPSAEEFLMDVGRADVAVAVVDTAAQLMRHFGVKRTDRDNTELARFWRPYIEAARECGTALILLHHTGKSGAEYSGPVQLGAAVDVILTLREPGARGGEEQWNEDRIDDGRRLLEGRGRGGITVNRRLSFDGQWYSLGDTPLPLTNRILNELGVAPASATSLSEMLKVRKDTVLSAIRDLQASGKVERRSRTYQLSAIGEEHLRPPAAVPAIGSQGNGSRQIQSLSREPI